MEITDEKIFKIALITSLIGLVGMIIFASTIEVKEIAIGEIDNGMVDEKVALTGVIDSTKTSKSGETMFLTLNDGKNKIPVMVFQSTLAEFQDAGVDLNSYNGKKVKIYGTLTQYNGAMELILDNSNSIKLI
ncbi:MAG: exodeoxyribonuclease VII large subunit [Methanobrevibacter sp.]|jgi:DNA/RNA endonuclease YhcR with UshA esterase domain|nr:exodeoxyribonuclease VII large subunit [Candidatus Methanoflexus mossambicus]